jgi:hypothetical protein
VHGTTQASCFIAYKKREQRWRVHVCIIIISYYYRTIRHNSLQKKERTSLHTVEVKNKNNTELCHPFLK